MRTKSKTPTLRIVGGTAYDSAPLPDGVASFRMSKSTFRQDSDDSPSAEGLSATAKNGRLRERRREIWRMAEATTRYWRTRLDFHDALSSVQRWGYQKVVPMPLSMMRIATHWLRSGARHS
jgi:hypothetical protein